MSNLVQFTRRRRPAPRVFHSAGVNPEDGEAAARGHQAAQDNALRRLEAMRLLPPETVVAEIWIEVEGDGVARWSPTGR